MAKTQFEALIEHIINDNEEAARDLLHDIVVAKSREIYNEMMEEEQVNEIGDETDDMIDDVEADEEGMGMDDAGDELGDEMGVGDDMGGDEMGDELGGDEMGMDGMGGEEELEDRVVDLEAALDELKAEFDQLMGGEDDMGMDDMGGDDMGMDDGMGSDDMGDGMDMSDEMDMPQEGVVREYVEKVSAPAKGEGQTVGSQSSSKPNVNTKSIVAGKNDMGGTVKNLVQGGAESAPDGTSAYKKPSNAYTKGQGEIEVARRSVNQPGGNKGASTFYSTKAKAKTGEESGTNDTSIIK